MFLIVRGYLLFTEKTSPVKDWHWAEAASLPSAIGSPGLPQGRKHYMCRVIAKKASPPK